MPSGRTHDRITLWSLPLIGGLTFGQTQNSSLTLLVSGGFLFGGLMFGPDLDIHSQQYRRWGPLRWIWLPYRRLMRHRSVWSHGPIIGTVGRICYLASWLAALSLAVIFVSALLYQITGQTDNWQILAQQAASIGIEQVGRSLQQSSTEWIALSLGLELGALSHVVSDWTGSTYKRWMSRRAKKTETRSTQPAKASQPTEPPPIPPIASSTPPARRHREPQLPPLKHPRND